MNKHKIRIQSVKRPVRFAIQYTPMQKKLYKRFNKAKMQYAEKIVQIMQTIPRQYQQGAFFDAVNVGLTVSMALTLGQIKKERKKLRGHHYDSRID